MKGNTIAASATAERIRAANIEARLSEGTTTWCRHCIGKDCARAEHRGRPRLCDVCRPRFAAVFSVCCRRLRVEEIGPSTRLLASSQGDSSFHFYEATRHRIAHRGVFFVDGVAETDGVHYLPVPIGRQYPHGLLVIQNGDAPEPPDTGAVNGYEFDGSTQFKYINFADARRGLRY
jgi:hypothetical protein